MKVGILSMQRVVNYGSFLQAYSLMKNMESLGHQVTFVDYEVGEVIVTNQETKEDRIARIVHKIYERLIPPRKVSSHILKENFEKLNHLEELFKEACFPLLRITEEKNICPKVDVLIIGSDEVFNCLQTNKMVGYSKQLFGDGHHAERVISYAASFGNTNYEGLIKYNIAEEIAEFLKKFDKISVRDKNSGMIVETLLGKAPEYHLDPVFLYDYTKEVSSGVNQNNYIVVYSYACRISKEEASAIIKFAKAKKKKIICLGGVQLYLNNYLAVSPFEALAYIKQADYVITDTFHGTVFSIKFNKKFAVYTRSGHELQYGNNEKLYDLLERFWLTTQKVDQNHELEQILLREIDYQKINQKIKLEKEKSLTYLKNAIKTAGNRKRKHA